MPWCLNNRLRAYFEPAIQNVSVMLGSIKRIDVPFSDYNGCQGSSLDLQTTLTFVAYDEQAN